MKAPELAFVATMLVALCGCGTLVSSLAPTTRPATAPSDPQVHARSVPEAIAAGVKFLQQSQNPDGSWGTGTVTRGTEVIASVPGSHDGFKVATTALAVMALKQAGESAAHDRGLGYLVSNRDAKRATPELIYNVWAHIYGVQCLAMELRDRPEPAIRQALYWHLDRLKRYQTYIGGWNYYDFVAGTQEPAMGPTSFGTAAGLLALWEAKHSGIDSDSAFVHRTIRRLQELRNPDGTYIYGYHLRYHPVHPANRVRGSIGRNQAGNAALLAWGSDLVTIADAVAGLELFFREHDYIQMGRKRPFPHESWYRTAAYYYYFGHYYASRLLSQLPARDRERFAPQLVEQIVKYQEPDGSWWDYAMWDYHKPYGTAFAVMTLLNCQNVSGLPASAGGLTLPGEAGRPVNHVSIGTSRSSGSQNSLCECLDIR